MHQFIWHPYMKYGEATEGRIASEVLESVGVHKPRVGQLIDLAGSAVRIVGDYEIVTDSYPVMVESRRAQIVAWLYPATRALEFVYCEGLVRLHRHGWLEVEPGNRASWKDLRGMRALTGFWHKWILLENG